LSLEAAQERVGAIRWGEWGAIAGGGEAATAAQAADKQGRISASANSWWALSLKIMQRKLNCPLNARSVVFSPDAVLDFDTYLPSGRRDNAEALRRK
jgi:hypothetical protein